MYPYDGILFGQEKEWSTDAFYMNFKNTMVSERNQSQSSYTVWFYLFVMSRIDEISETAGRLVAVTGLGKKTWEVTIGDLFLGWGKCSQSKYCWWLYNLMNTLRTTELYILKEQIL